MSAEHTPAATPPRVLRLWRYPVKSLGGELREALALTHAGVDGDRCYAVRSADGKLGSGKNTRRFCQIDGLLALRAIYESDGVPCILFPDGARIGAAAPEIHGALSTALGQKVTLSRAVGGSHVDAAPVHILTTASLAWLQGADADARLDERRFRPNLLLETAGDTPVEQQWIGRTLGVGEAVLRIVEPTKRCRMVTLTQRDLPEDPRILRQLARHGDALFGAYAEVAVPGIVRRGDAVRFLATPPIA